ncbi:MAG: alpha/beta hydrolase [Candidatus Sericytochromatia bacterium]|nr:alpha/beta hydrolase [Candidatus Sericytochromatia bacterium]
MLEFVRRMAHHGMRLNGATVGRQTIGGCDVGYYRLGRGKQPALLIHGIGDRSVHWQGIAMVLRDVLDMTIPDMPGCGLSTLPPGRTFISSAESRHILHTLVEPLADQRPLLIGHSLGGLFAAKMMLEAPERYSGLVLINPGGLKLPESARDGKIFRDFLAFGDRMEIFQRIFHQPPAFMRIVAPGIQRQLQAPVVLDFIDAMHDYDMITPAEVAQLPAHGLLFLGEEDQFLPPGTLEGYAVRFPGQVTWLPNSAHASQVECAGQIAGAIRRMLSPPARKTWVQNGGSVVTSQW